MMTVLIADDSKYARKVALECTNSAKLDCIGLVGNGYDVLEQCRRNCPDIILMDVLMPKLDGLTTLRKLHSEFPGVKVIMCTECENPQLCVDAMAYGASSYIYKSRLPYDFEEVVQNVTK